MRGNHGKAFRRQAFCDRGCEPGPVFNVHPVPAHCPRNGGKIGLTGIDTEVLHTRRALFHFNQRQRSINKDDDNHRQFPVAQRRQFAQDHFQTGIAG